MQYNLIGQFSVSYLAEKHGCLRQFIDAFASQRKYFDHYFREIEAFSAEDGGEVFSYWITQAGYVGSDTAHL